MQHVKKVKKSVIFLMTFAMIPEAAPAYRRTLHINREAEHTATMAIPTVCITTAGRSTQRKRPVCLSMEAS